MCDAAIRDRETMGKKRKLDSTNVEQPKKRIKVVQIRAVQIPVPEQPGDGDANANATSSQNTPKPHTPLTVNATQPSEHASKAPPIRSGRRIHKLVPPRPFPTVPTSVSATGPRSAHTEGKNYICLTRKTPLGAYMRRCKNLILKDGYKTLHMSAMGAAIPHLVQLSVALPPILPFSPEEIRLEITTGTAEVRDEIIPDDEDEDINYQTRGKSTLMIVIKIGDGELEGDRSGPAKTGKNSRKETGNVKYLGKATEEPGEGKERSRGPTLPSQQVVFQEPEQDNADMV